MVSKLAKDDPKPLAILAVRLVFVFCIAWIFLSSGLASAAYSNLPTKLSPTYDQYMSTKDNDDGTGRGNHTPSFAFLLYTKADGSRADSVYIDKSPSVSQGITCSDFDLITQQAVTNDSPEDGSDGVSGPINKPDCEQNGNGIRLTNLTRTTNNNQGSFSAYACSYRFASLPENCNDGPQYNPQYYVTMIKLNIKDGSRFIQVRVINSDDDRLSYVGNKDVDASDPSSAWGVSYSIPDAKDTSVISVPFAPSCNYKGGQVRVYWKDADSSKPPNGNNQVKYYIYEQGRSDPIDDGDAGNGDGTFNSRYFSVQAGKKYRVVFSPVRGRNASHAANTIKVWIPFDSAAAYVSCSNKPKSDATCLRYKEFNTDSGDRYRISIFGGEAALSGLSTYVVDDHTYVTRGSSLNRGDTRSSRDWIDWGTGGLPARSQGLEEFTGDGSDKTFLYDNHLADGHAIVVEQWSPVGTSSWKYVRAEVFTRGSCNISCSMQVSPKLNEATLTNSVRAGEPYTVDLYITNNGTEDLPNPSTNGSKPLALSSDYGVFQLEDGLNAGETQYVGSINQTAPNKYGSYPLGNVYPDYVGLSSLGGYCPASIHVYQPYNLTPSTLITSTSEDPSPITYTTEVTQTTSTPYYGDADAPGGIDTDTTSTLTKQNTSSIVDTHSESSVYGNASYDYSYLPPSLLAGDRYCATIKIDDAHGYIYPGHQQITTGSETSDPRCMTIINKPYFKVYGAGVSAGGGFCRADGSCPGGAAARGEISSWNNNSGTYPFGAGAQIAALTDGQITGFGSGQTTPPTINDRGTILSFANRNVATSQSAYSPKQGGSFGAYNPATPIELDNPEVQAGGYTLGGRTVSDNQAVQVNGDVYINGNITFGGGGVKWSSGGVPSFVLKATGNIYISPSVTRLDGIYASTKKNGVIYTCAKSAGAGFAPINGDTDTYYSTCSNQLTVRGSFIADKVALMRTFGSLRDEKFTPPVINTTAATAGITGSMIWTEAASPTNNGLPQTGSSPSDYGKPATGIYFDSQGRQCTSFAEGAEPTSNYWYDNFLCLSKADTDAGIRIVMDQNSSDESKARAHTRLAYCDSINDAVADSAHAWGDNYLCSSMPISVQRGNSANNLDGRPQSCISISESADKDNSRWSDGNTYVCIVRATSTTTVTTPAQPATFPRLCSNGTVQSRTCAAEVFEFSPEFYLSKPKIKLPSNGALQFDAITSLPPVL